MAEAKVTKKKKDNIFKRVKNFFVETKSELKKATWPSKKQLFHNTIVILVFIVVIAIILSVLDFGFAEMFKALTKLF